MANDLRALQAAIAGEPTNQQIDELWDEVASYFHLYDEARELVREALARWGPRAALAEGAGVGVTDEELETLVIAIQALVPIVDDGTHLLEAVDKGRGILRRALHNYGTTHPRPIPVAEWNEDDGDVLWWRLPVEEPPYVGSPLCDDWVPGYYTHFTRLQVPAAAIPLPEVDK